MWLSAYWRKVDAFGIMTFRRHCTAGFGHVFVNVLGPDLFVDMIDRVNVEFPHNSARPKLMRMQSRHSSKLRNERGSRRGTRSPLRAKAGCSTFSFICISALNKALPPSSRLLALSRSSESSSQIASNTISLRTVAGSGSMICRPRYFDASSDSSPRIQAGSACFSRRCLVQSKSRPSHFFAGSIRSRAAASLSFSRLASDLP